MADQQRRVPREIWTGLALSCVAFSSLTVVLVGALQVGVPSCIVCHSSDCNGNNLTYCNGGLPVLWATVVGLTVGAFGFGICAGRGLRRNWQGETHASKDERAILTPLRRWMLGLAVMFDGVALATLGLWMAADPARFCAEACAPRPYSLTGIPLALTLLGTILLVPGVLLLLMSLSRQSGPPTVEPRLGRSA